MMEVLNLAASALFNALDKNNLDKSLLIEGTGLTMDEILKLNKKHRWDCFVKMYDNCGNALGYEKVAKEIAYTGIFNENISLITKVGRSFIDCKALYWYTSTFVAKHLYKDCVTFNYINSAHNSVIVEIEIREDLVDCPILFETYIHLFEILPSVLGLPRAKVHGTISPKKGRYEIFIKQATIFKKISSRINSFFHGNTSSIELMDQLETQSEELSNAVEEKSQLLRVVSHDVANQVITIDYYLNKLQESKNLTEEEKKCLKIAKSSSSKLSNILKNVQNMEATSARGIILSPVNVGTIFNYIRDDFEPQLVHKKLNLITRCDLSENVRILVESSLFETNVLGNLITNAIKFSPEGSTIELTARQVDENVCICVIDQGCGITPEEKETIFAQKIRKSSVGTGGEIGTGFGLGIVANYVKMFNGKIHIESNYPSGCNFIISLKAHYN